MNTARTPQQIEAEIEDVRERMDTTLDELEYRLDPRRMMRDGLAQLAKTEVVRYATSAASSAGRTARDHPMPTALAGVGLLSLVAWGMRAGSHSRSRARRSRRDHVSEAVDSARQRLGSARDTLMESASSAQRRVRDAGSEAWQRVAGSEASSMARSHPVAAGAIALAVIALATIAATPAVRHRISDRW